jgi:hypothetical protein
MRQHFLLAVAVAFAAACSDDPTGPGDDVSAETRTDVAAATGEAIATDVEAMSRTEASGSASLFAFAGNPSASCTFSVGSFLCTNTFGPFEGEATVTFRDDDGAAQDDFDDDATASIEIETDITADIDRPNFELQFARTGDFAVTGLAGAEASRTWNGSATMSVSGSLFAADRSYTMSSSTSFSAVVVPTSGAEPRWPTSGSVTTQVNWSATAGPDAGESGNLTATVQFNGTSQVPLTVGGTTYTLDLQTHAVAEAN